MFSCYAVFLKIFAGNLIGQLECIEKLMQVYVVQPFTQLSILF